MYSCSQRESVHSVHYYDAPKINLLRSQRNSVHSWIFSKLIRKAKKKKKGQDLISFKGKPQLKFEDVIIIYFLNEAIFVWKEHPVPGSLTFSASDFHRSLQQRLNVSKTHPQHAALLLEMGFHGLGSSRPCIGIIESCQPSPTNGRAARPVSIKKDMKVSQKAKSYKLS